jgi:hypothetical protein
MKSLIAFAFAILLILPAAAFADGNLDRCYVNDTTGPSHHAADIIGHSPAEIHARFAGIIEKNLEGNDRIKALSPKELADLAFTYHEAGGTKLEATFNDRFATFHTAAASAAPNVGMTLEEIYLDFRTAPIGALGVEAALYETFMFAGVEVWGAAQFGWSLGTEIGNLIKTYDPSLDAAINNFIATEVENFMSASTWTQEGSIEEQSDYHFGEYVPLLDAGDFSVVNDMAVMNGGC